MCIRQIGLVLVLILGASGCGFDPSTPTSVRRDQLARVHRELGLDPPFRYLGGAAMDDGGTGVLAIAGAGPETLRIYTDNRPWAPRTFGSDSLVFPGRHVWLDAYPLQPDSRRLEFGSAVESAVADLMRLQVASLMSAAEESSLVRGERRARHPKRGDPGYHWTVWNARLDNRQRDVYFLRGQIGTIDWRRAHPAPDLPGDTLSCLPRSRAEP